MPAKKVPVRRRAPARQQPRTVEVDSHRWHLDKRVNVSIIIALALQGAVGLTWANRLTFDVTALKKSSQQATILLKEQDKRLDRLIAMEGKVEAISLSLRNATRKLDKVTELSTKLESIDLRMKEYREAQARLWAAVRSKADRTYVENLKKGQRNGQ